MIRVIALITASFLFLSTLESWAWIWLAGRWFYSSRYASLTLGVISRWLNGGLISRSTQWVKVFINRNGKWILVTLFLGDVIRELDRYLETSSFCYVPKPYGSAYSYFDNVTHEFRTRILEVLPGAISYTTSGKNCVNTGYLPAYPVYRLSNGYWSPYSYSVPIPGTYELGVEADTSKPCYVTITAINIPQCSFSSQVNPPSFPTVPASSSDLPLDNERREVPVHVIPNPGDFVRPEVINSDPALQWLRDEYQRISADSSIPDVSSDLVGVGLPQIGWSIPPEEAVDSSAESSDTSKPSNPANSTPANPPAEGSKPDDTTISVPGFDTSLPSIERKPFPVELIDSIVQNHPLLKVIRNINFDAGIGGSCVIGSGTFTISFCEHAWVLNLMGAIIVPVAFLAGLFAWRNE
jgi:hypothetical protein